MSIIAAALEFLHARKWLVELLLAASLVAGVWMFCQHLIEVGVQRQKDVDAREYAEAQRKADQEYGRKLGQAEAASHAHDQELTDLRKYRDDHPLHGSLRNALGCTPQAAAVRPVGATDENDARAATGEGSIQQVPSGSAERGEGPDQLGMLDALAARADLLSAALREWQANR